nr:integrase, catalytic region, zinc finger, CCHC-type, peptidase aspartic, catalytic [Tanacetum cinerariifolium]
MANLLKDIQCAGSDTRPPMLDRTDFASWKQRIRLYCRGKENGVNILKSIDEGPYQMGIVREPLLKAQKEHLIWVQNDLEFTPACLLKKRIGTMPTSEPQIYYFKGCPRTSTLSSIIILMQKTFGTMGDKIEGRDESTGWRCSWIWRELGMLIRVKQDRLSATTATAEDCDAFNSDVDEAPTAQTMFMANLSSADPVTDEARPSYDSDILSEVQDHDHYQDAVCAYHKEHAIHDNVQLNQDVDTHADHTSDSNMIPYDQPKPYYNELNKVAIGYKNPLCLTRAKKVQPALYNGHEIIKDNHVPAIVHNTEDTLEIAEITRKKINDKIKDPECVTRKVKIAPHDYSKENFLATFTPQKQLNPE